MARVSIENAAFRDARYQVLGQHLGITKWDALARCAAVWDYCQERGATTLPAELIDALHPDLPNFSAAMIRAYLARDVEGGVYVAGSNGRVEWLDQLRTNAPKGGKARQASISSEEKSALGKAAAEARWGNREMPEPDLPAGCQPSGSHDASALAPALTPVGSNLSSPKKEKVGSKTASSSASEEIRTWTTDDDEAAEDHVEIVTKAIRMLCPNVKPKVQRRNVLNWIANYRDKGPFWIVAALAEGGTTIARARSPGYIDQTLRNRLNDGFECPDAESYVRFRMKHGFTPKKEGQQ